MRLYRPAYTSEYGLFAAPLTHAVRILLILNVIFFVVRLVVNSRAPHAFDILFGLSEDLYKNGFVWQLFTYMFLHGNVLHLAFNMLVLYFLGTEIERTLGSREFLLIYFISGLLGGLGWLLLSSGGLCIGASGAVFGLLGAYVALFPNRYITVLIFFILPVTLRAWALAAILGGIEFLLMASNVDDRIAHSAHLAGLVAGYVFAFTVYRKGGFRMPRVRIHRPGRQQPNLTVLRREDAQPPTSGEIDAILDKIASQGMSSLTAEERKLLEKASQDWSNRR
jgi:membrane associated rhomboid family serine protease